jgi:hypothetical protein
MIVNWRLALLLAAIVLPASAGFADGPFANPSFEVGTAGWTRYSYSVPPVGDPALPVTGGVGSGQVFDAIPPSTIPNGDVVCGMQCDEGVAKNGGVYQVRYDWDGGPGTIYVTARAYSEWPDEMGPYPDGCGVRMGLVAGAVSDRSAVTNWVWFPWGPGWATRSVSVPGNGTYTLFIESYQPYPSLICSTLWDNVTWEAVPPIHIVQGPDVTIPGNEDYPDSTALITWRTDVASTSKVEYGPTADYGSTVTQATPTTNHSVLLTNLNHSSSYHFRVSSSASGYVACTSDDQTFLTPIQFSDAATSVSPDGLSTIFTWRTDVPCTSQVEYGDSTSYGHLSDEDTDLVQDHSLSISTLLQDHTYHFRLRGRNQPLFSDAVSSDHVFTTLPNPTSSLQNGSFELGHDGQTPSLYPWVQYNVIDPFGQTYAPIDGIIGPYPASGQLSWYKGIKAQSGSYFLGAGGQRKTKNGGVLQRIFVTPDTYYTFGAHLATVRQGGTDNDLRVKIGMDPDGGVDPTSENVRWWSTYSPTNDSQWHWATMAVKSGSGGVMTVFLHIQQLYANPWMVAAVDNVSFGTPSVMSIGQVKQAVDPLGVTLQGKIVTRVESDVVIFNGQPYTKAYIQETNCSAGIAVLFDRYSEKQPAVTNLVDLTGSLVLNGMEATIIAYDWDFDTGERKLPKPVALVQKALGGSARNQPGVMQTLGLSNHGLLVRIFGKVTMIESENLPFADAIAYIDDGSHMLERAPVPPEEPLYGIRVRLIDDFSRTVRKGDYVAVTGVLKVPLIDPDGWPSTDDEYYDLTVETTAPEDWDLLHSLSPP